MPMYRLILRTPVRMPGSRSRLICLMAYRHACRMYLPRFSLLVLIDVHPYNYWII